MTKIIIKLGESDEDIDRKEYEAMRNATSAEKLVFLRKKEIEQLPRSTMETAEKLQKFWCLKLADALVNRLTYAAEDDLNWWLVSETAKRILETQVVQHMDYELLATMFIELPEVQDIIGEISDLEWNEWKENNK